MVDEVDSENLKIVAHHEAAHAFMNRLFRRPIGYIKLCCTNGVWHGETKPYARQNDSDDSDLNKWPSGQSRPQLTEMRY
jgi:hypothetical protein